MTMLVLVVRAYTFPGVVDADGTQYPTIEHRFYGRTQHEADTTYRAHLQVDAALRGCVLQGALPDGTLCTITTSWERA